MAKTFICYSRVNERAVRSLAHDIEQLGHNVWFDVELSGGQSWWDQILQRIRDVDVVVVALSTHSMDSEACRREFNYAARLGKSILPVLVDEGVVDELIPPALSAIQYVDFRAADREALTRLSRALTALPPAGPLAEPLPEPPELPVSYLGALRERIETDDPMDLSDQSTLLIELKQFVQDMETRSDGLTLLRVLRKRPDLLATIAAEIDALEAHASASSGRAGAERPKTASPKARAQKRPVSKPGEPRATRFLGGIPWSRMRPWIKPVGAVGVVAVAAVALWQLWGALPGPDAPEIGSFAVSGAPGGDVTIEWSTSGADRVSLLPGVGEVEGTGSVTVPPVAASELMLVAYNRGGVSRRAATNPAPVGVPVIIDFSSDRDEVDEGDPVTLTWNTSGAETVELTPGSRTLDPSGTITVYPSRTTEYFLYATGMRGEVERSLQVRVNRPPPPPPPPPPEIVPGGGTGTIAGRVVNASTGRPIAAVQVFVEGLNLGVLTQQNGAYLVNNVPAGRMYVTAARIGYQSATQSASVEGGGTTALDFNLAEGASELIEIVVSGVSGPTPPSMAEDSLNAPVWIEGGTFSMGSPETPEEQPVRRVAVSGFWIQEHEVTNAEYRRLVPDHVFPPGEERHPVTGIGWEEATEYAMRLRGRLPTEAQWEFAARGGASRTYPWGEVPPTCARSNYLGCAGAPEPVGSHSLGETPQPAVVQDLAGNASEWVDDLSGPYDLAESNDPRGPDSGTGFVSRGGSFESPPETLRSSYRSTHSVGRDRDPEVGFRVAWPANPD